MRTHASLLGAVAIALFFGTAPRVAGAEAPALRGQSDHSVERTLQRARTGLQWVNAYSTRFAANAVTLG